MKKMFSLFMAVLIIMTGVFPSFAQETAKTVSLAEAYKDYFLIGSVFSPQQIPGDLFERMKKDYNVLTAENAMKPDAMQRSKGNFNFTDVDKAVQQILDAGMKLHGHTLTWHSQSPAFLNKGVTRAEAEQNLADHINGVAGHFSGKVISWDVLNEAMNDGPSNPENWRGALRKSDWYNAFAQDGNGEDYIYLAFKLARDADPDAVLYYNDYNLNVKNKAQAVYYMVKELNERYLAEGNERLLIEGVGMQGHYNVNTNVSEVEKSIELFTELGVEISISELDVTIPGASKSGLSKDDELRQAIVYAQLFSMFKKHADVITRVTLWGMSDAMSWRGEQYPLLYNRDFTPKLAYFAVADPEGFMAEHSITNIEVKKRLVGTAVYGMPSIDGKIDEIWDEAEILPIDQMIQAWQTASGSARIMWDEENLYVLAEVKDTALDKSSFNKYEQDSVEIYVDEKNCKKSDFMTEDKHFRVCFDGSVSFGTGGKAEGFEAVATSSGTSYSIEMKIPFSEITPENGITIGFDAQINDGKNGGRVGISKWNDPTDNSYLDTSGWGEVMLVNDEDAPQATEAQTSEADNDTAESEETQNKNEEEVATSSNNIVSDNSLVIILTIAGAVIIVGAIITFILFKKKSIKK